MKQQYEFEQPTTERSTSKMFYQLWIILMCLFITGVILDRYNKPVETRKIYHLNEYRGTIIDFKPISIDEHCNGL